MTSSHIHNVTVLFLVHSLQYMAVSGLFLKATVPVSPRSRVHIEKLIGSYTFSASQRISQTLRNKSLCCCVYKSLLLACVPEPDWSSPHTPSYLFKIHFTSSHSSKC